MFSRSLLRKLRRRARLAKRARGRWRANSQTSSRGINSGFMRYNSEARLDFTLGTTAGHSVPALPKVAGGITRTAVDAMRGREQPATAFRLRHIMTDEQLK